MKEKIKKILKKNKAFLKKRKILWSIVIKTINIFLEQKRKKIIKKYSFEIFYLNIGGGRFARKNWRILDYASDHYNYNKNLIDFNINLLECKKWEIKDSAIDLIYTSHCFEHLTNDSVNFAFKEVFRILKAGGVFRINVPNIDLAYSAYYRDDNYFFKQLGYKRKNIEECFLEFFSSLHPEKINIDSFKNDFRSLSKEEFLNKYEDKNIDFLKHDFSLHINWFNYKKIKKIALEAGFKEEEIYLSAYKQSISQEMRNSEFDITHPEMAIYIDIIK